jgi:hypothetical protein
MPHNGSNVHERGNTVVKSVSYYNSNFDASKNYTKDEAVELIGKQVRNLSRHSSKCPKESGNCQELFDGESGKIIGMVPSMNNTFVLEILWTSTRDTSEQSFVSYVGKELSFEVIK